MLGSISVPTNGTLVGNFRYATLSNPIPLTAGDIYTVGALSDTAKSTWNPEQFSEGSAISYLGDAYSPQSANLTFPSETAGFYGGAQGYAYFGGNFQYSTSAPEPTALAIVGIGALFCLTRRRVEA